MEDGQSRRGAGGLPLLEATVTGGRGTWAFLVGSCGALAGPPSWLEGLEKTHPVTARGHLPLQGDVLRLLAPCCGRPTLAPSHVACRRPWGAAATQWRRWEPAGGTSRPGPSPLGGRDQAGGAAPCNASLCASKGPRSPITAALPQGDGATAVGYSAKSSGGCWGLSGSPRPDSGSASWEDHAQAGGGARGAPCCLPAFLPQLGTWMAHKASPSCPNGPPWAGGLTAAH